MIIRLSLTNRWDNHTLGYYRINVEDKEEIKKLIKDNFSVVFPDSGFDKNVFLKLVRSSGFEIVKIKVRELEMYLPNSNESDEGM